MTRIIPRELIKHLEWVPGQEVPKRPPEGPAQTAPSNSAQYSIDNILHGQTFYDDSLPVALQQALDHATPEGIVATMPELIAAKLKADKSHDFWQKWYSVHTEEDIGIDKKGTFCRRNDPVLVVVHGGGILTPDRIKQAYDEGLISGSAKYRDEEFDGLLDGRLPNGDSIQFYTLEELKKGISGLPHRHGIVIPYSIAQETKSGYHQKADFLANPLVIARAGGMENLEEYYERAKDSDGDLGNYHPFSGRDASQSQGRVLFLDDDNGLLGSNLIINGRFVGVAPEARSARK